MMISRSEDGGRNWTAARRFAAGTPAPQAPEGIIRASPQIPSFAIDAAGTLYGAWQDSRFSLGARNDIVFTRSTDQGAHWSSPRRIEPSGPAGALIPTVGASGAQRVAVQYLALSGDSPRLEARYRAVVSADGREHFTSTALSTPFAITDAPQLTSSPLVPGGYFLGDYMGVAPSATRASGWPSCPRPVTTSTRRTSCTAESAEGHERVVHRPGAGEACLARLRRELRAAVLGEVAVRHDGERLAQPSVARRPRGPGEQAAALDQADEGAGRR
jgi:hypothetical protein